MISVLLDRCSFDWRTSFRSRLEIAKYLAYFLLLYFFSSRVSWQIVVSATGWGKDHVIDEFVDALAICVVEYFADYALKEGFVLELGLFLLLVFIFFLAFVMFWERVVVGVFLFRLCPDEAVEVGLGRIEFKWRVVFFQQLIHAPQ